MIQILLNTLMMYADGSSVVDKFLWDGKESNLCQKLPERQNPYNYPWVSSHFRTFSLSLFYEVPIPNFIHENNSFYPRCYDHALMLPMLYLCYKYGLKTQFIDRYLYYYDNSGSSTPSEEHTQGRFESSLSHSIRSRGFNTNLFK